MGTSVSKYSKIEGKNKFEVVEDELGVRTTLSMRPKYISFDEKAKIIDKVVETEKGEKTVNTSLELPAREQKRLIFDLHSMELVSSKMLYEQNPQGNLVVLEPLSVSRFYSPIYYNNINNMPTLRYNNKLKMNTCHFVDYVSVMKFKNGDVYYNVNEKAYAYNLAQKKLFLYKNDRYELKMRQGEGTTSLVKNGRLLMTDADILDFFQNKIWDSWIYTQPHDKHEDMKVFRDLFEESFISSCLDSQESIGFSPEFLLTLYRVKRNKNLKDLPWKEHELTNLYGFTSKEFDSSTYIENTLDGFNTTEGWLEICSKQKSNALKNINRYLRKGDSFKATNACFYSYNYPKAVRKLLLQSKPLEFTKKAYDLLYELCMSIGVNNTLDIISKDRKTLNKLPLEQPALLQAYVDGFKKSELKRINEDDELLWDSISTLVDMFRMENTLKREGIDVTRTTKSYKRHHNNISRIYTSFSQATSGAELDAFKKVDTSEQLPKMQVDELLLRSPTTAVELVDVGSEMHHCVASYVASYFYKTTDFLLITDKQGRYLACIEIKGKHIVQAKLKYNNPVYSDEVVFNALKQWADKHEYKLACSDCKTSRPLNLVTPKKCEERIALVQEVLSEVKSDKMQSILNAEVQDEEDEEQYWGWGTPTVVEDTTPF